MERPPQTYERPEQLTTWLRQQLWTTPDGPKDLRLQQVVRERLTERDGRYALSWNPVRIGVVTWAS